MARTIGWVVAAVLAGAAALMLFGSAWGSLGESPLDGAANAAVARGDVAEPGLLERVADDAKREVVAELPRTDAQDLGDDVAPVADARQQAAEKPPAAARLRGRVVDARGDGVAQASVIVRAGEQNAFAARLVEQFGDETGAIRSDATGGFEVELDRLGAYRLIVRHDLHPQASVEGEADRELVEGIVVVMRDGASIRGRIVEVPAEVTGLSVIAAPARTAAGGPMAMFNFDFSDLTAGMGVGSGVRRVDCDAAHGFELRGLDPDVDYDVFGMRGDAERRLPAKCTEQQNLRAGAQHIELRWRPSLTLVARVVEAESGSPVDALECSVGAVRELAVMGMSVPIIVPQQRTQHELQDGALRLDDIAAPESSRKVVSLHLRAHGYRVWQRDDIDASAGGVIDLGEIRLEPAPLVRVHVVDALDGRAIVAAKVELEPQPDDPSEPGETGGGVGVFTSFAADDDGAEGSKLVATTDAAGLAEITADCNAKRVLIHVTAADDAPHAAHSSAPIELPRGRVVLEHRIQLSRGGTLHVTVVDSRGAPVKGAIELHHTPPGDEEPRYVPLAADGTTRLTQLTAGEHVLRAVERSETADTIFAITSQFESDADDVSAARVTVVSDAEHAVRLVWLADATVRGVVTLDGLPLDGARVRFESANANSAEAASRAVVGQVLGSMFGGNLSGESSAQTDALGEFAIERTRPGSRQLVIEHADLAMPNSRVIELQEGDNTLEIALQTTRVIGRALDAAGEALAGATISIEVAQDHAVSSEELSAVIGELFGANAGAGPGKQGERTGRDGRFELRGVRDGVPLRVRATGSGLVDAIARIDAIPLGGTYGPVELRLSPGGRLRVVAAESMDPAASSVRATWLGAEDAPPHARERTAILRRGRTVLDGMLPGRWRVELLGQPGPLAAVAPKEIEVIAGQLVTVEW